MEEIYLFARRILVYKFIKKPAKTFCRRRVLNSFPYTRHSINALSAACALNVQIVQKCALTHI